MPSTPYDAKGLMVAAIREPNPVVFIDDRLLYGVEGVVPENLYEVPIGKGCIYRSGNHVSVISLSYGTHLAMKAAVNLEKKGIDAEIIDLRSVKPLDIELIVSSVKKTGLAVVVDVGWQSFGVSAEIATIISEHCFASLRYPVCRLALPDIPAPSAYSLEDEYYFSEHDIENCILNLFETINIKTDIDIRHNTTQQKTA
jgi:pyruvate dehydrogenase E1 component beta subunit